jgi:3-oxoacyl-[acyl-carrier-protein] synthase II
VCAILDGIAPPTLNLKQPDPKFLVNLVPEVAQPCKMRVAMSNSFGFGGTNVSLVFRAMD